MRRSEAILLLAVATSSAGCEDELGDFGQDASAPDTGPTLPIASGCRPFQSLAGVDAVTGTFRSLDEGDGGVLVVVDDAIVGDADVPSLALTAPSSATLGDCLGAATLVGGAPVSAFDDASLSPLSGVVAGGAALLYYTDGYGSVGVATQAASDGLFHPGSTLLWTADRPPYGTAVVTSGGSLFAIGCQSARFLDTDCFVADVPIASVDDESAYSYYVGGGRFSPSIDDAWPMTTGATSLDVAWLTQQNRWLMVYTTPLGATLTVRSGLTPEGPWSAPIEVATCDLADADMFCVGVHVHPWIDVGPEAIAVSYAPASLSSDAAARRVANPQSWGPRIVALAIPPLP